MGIGGADGANVIVAAFLEFSQCVIAEFWRQPSGFDFSFYIGLELLPV
jgi:hypothetical protein